VGGRNVGGEGWTARLRGRIADSEVWMTTRNVKVESLDKIPIEDQQVGSVERKGVGHPDSICDAIMEEISVALCGEHRATFGHIVYHGIDRGALVACRTSPSAPPGSG